MSTPTIIYALVNPVNQHPYYVGKTSQIKLTDRLKQHIRTKSVPTTKALLENGITPEIIELDTFEWLDSAYYFFEAYWIFQLRAWGFSLDNVNTSSMPPNVDIANANRRSKPRQIFKRAAVVNI